MYKPLVVDKIVEKDICTGCGICTAVCNNSSLKMDWNDSGFLVPFEINQCDLNGSCIKVCPFNPSPDDEVKTENEISNITDPASQGRKPKSDNIGEETSKVKTVSWTWKIKDN